MASSIFRDTRMNVPKDAANTVRVDMEQADFGGRKSNLPADSKSDKMTISHVPSPGNAK